MYLEAAWHIKLITVWVLEQNSGPGSGIAT